MGFWPALAVITFDSFNAPYNSMPMKKIKILGRRDLFLLATIAFCTISIVGVCLLWYNVYLVSMLGIALLWLLYTHLRSVSARLNDLNRLSAALDKGEFPEMSEAMVQEPMIQHLSSTHHKIQEIIHFVRNLGQESFDFQHIDSQDVIGRSLHELSSRHQQYNQCQEPNQLCRQRRHLARRKLLVEKSRSASRPFLN